MKLRAVQAIRRLVSCALVLAACALPEVQQAAEVTCQAPAGAQCELLTDCGCPEDKTCRVDGTSSGETKCGGVGAVLHFEPCSRESDCARRSDCIGGVCKPYCQSDADCSGSPGQCAEIATSQGTVRSVKVCRDGLTCAVPTGGACELISDCGCAGAQTCRVVAAVTGRTACGQVGTARDFEPCSSEVDCARGLDCIGGACKPYCTSDAECAAQQAGACGPIATKQGEVPGARVCAGN